ncbi:uncharacterized protein L203_105987 [Cryptococcus depauperatus CBS 7841]|uniref:WD-repeat protein n=1 Tax=Cryptococcus depauperatus CBS 7841 TaxID=1295531 RepID=A0AAJ8JYN9_9TREE
MPECYFFFVIIPHSSSDARYATKSPPSHPSSRLHLLNISSPTHILKAVDRSAVQLSSSIQNSATASNLEPNLQDSTTADPVTVATSTSLAERQPGVWQNLNRGTVRPRSPSEEEEELRPKQRIRQSAAEFPLSNIDPTPSTEWKNREMGQPMYGDDTTGSNAVPSASTNGTTVPRHHSVSPSILSSIITCNLPGHLMYEDDSDWAEIQEKHKQEGEGEGIEEEEMDGKVSARLLPIRPGMGGGKRMPVERDEAVRLILQGLRDMGYHQSADVLEKESGYSLETQAATDFQNAILGGRWSEALALLSEFGIITPESDTEENSLGKDFTSADGQQSENDPANQVRLLIAQQNYLEYLELGQQKKALGVLRGDLARVVKDQEVLHTLSGFMMCLDREDLYERASWDGAAGISRRQLLEHLQEVISPKYMIPSRRLSTLFTQARQYQQHTSPFLEQPTANSLYSDYKAEQPEFPSITTHVLMDHTDEVWRIEWSPDGSKLASAGKDRLVVIWNVESTSGENGATRYNVTPLRHLEGHNDPIDAMAWSPDGKLLITGAEKNVHIWDTETGEQIPKTTPGLPHTDTISAIQWLPSGQEFLVASMDCCIIFYDRMGKLLRQWSTFPLQFNDCVLTHDGTRIVGITTPLKRVTQDNRLQQATSRPTEGGDPNASGSSNGPGLSLLRGTQQFAFASMEHSIVMVRVADHEIVDWSKDLRCEMTSIKLSSDGKRALVSCTPDEIQEWSIQSGLKYLRRHTGHIQNNFLIRSCFGSIKDQYVLSGSEDGHVYVWRGISSYPTEVLSGHSNVVNAVAWNPIASRKIFASCSDDNTVRIWQPPVNIGVLNGMDQQNGMVDGAANEDAVKDGMEL